MSRLSASTGYIESFADSRCIAVRLDTYINCSRLPFRADEAALDRILNSFFDAFPSRCFLRVQSQFFGKLLKNFHAARFSSRNADRLCGTYQGSCILGQTARLYDKSSLRLPSDLCR